ncbi:hypothetical protein KY347_05730 [Candidatus Woesearchaeota archaeon]|nr:hypothetical protein [Candidatus Woesearchaeota archaeon]
MLKKKEIEIAEKKLLGVISNLKEQGICSGEILSLVERLLKAPAEKEVEVPISVFRNYRLSALETITKYLRENMLLSFKQIASLTNRNPVALAVTYRNAKTKMEAKFVEEISPYHIPVSILKNRKLSVLENLVSYFKDTFGLTYHKIAFLLNRDDRTIWTVYQRAKKK